jgi:hypothetical protein
MRNPFQEAIEYLFPEFLVMVPFAFWIVLRGYLWRKGKTKLILTMDGLILAGLLIFLLKP